MRYLKWFNEGKKDKFPNLKKIDIDGFLVYVGMDALSNDHLSFNMADKDDMWFHVKGVPGSHVLVKIKDNLPTMEVIKMVAKLAVKHSKSRSDQSAVVYCKAKFIKKEPGMNPGQVRVDYKNAHEISV